MGANANDDKKLNDDNQDLNAGVEPSNDDNLDDGGDDSQNDGQNKNGQNDGDEKTFTQTEVNKMMAREKQQGRNSVYNALGIKPGDKKAIEALKRIYEAQKDPDDSGDDGDASGVTSELEHELAVSNARVEAMKLGVNAKYVDDVVTLAMSRIESDDEADLTSVIGEFKQKYPDWFTVNSDDDKDKGKRGTGSSLNPKTMGSNNGKDESGSFGKRLAAQRKPAQKNFSHWGKHN